MGAGRVATEHLFLAMLHDGGWPVSVLTGAGILDADQAENAVVAAMSAPGYIPSAGPPLPGGRIARQLGDSYRVDGGASRAVLDDAFTSLGRR
jgi:hypothetical protein